MLEKAKMLINILCQLLPFVFGPKEIEVIVKKINLMNNTNYTVHHGATRIVILGNDFVIKFEYGHNVKHFGGNKAEAKMYAKAAKAGFAYLFAKPTLIEQNGITFSVMPRINNVGRYDKFIFDYLTEKEEKWIKDNKIWDLHEKNYGFIGDKPVIIDYACNPAKDEPDQVVIKDQDGDSVLTERNPFAKKPTILSSLPF